MRKSSLKNVVRCVTGLLQNETYGFAGVQRAEGTGNNCQPLNEPQNKPCFAF